MRQLEEGKGRLDEAIDAYTRGALLKRHCETKLAEAEARIERIVLGPDGAVSDRARQSRLRTPIVAALAVSLGAAAEAVTDRTGSPAADRRRARARLREAMRYAALDGGKRLRPFLVIETAGLFNVSTDFQPARRGGDRDGALLFAGP